MSAIAIADQAFAFVGPALQKLELEKNQKGAMVCVAAGAFFCICMVVLGSLALLFVASLLEDEKCSQG